MKASAPKTAVVLYLAAMVLIHAVVFWSVKEEIQKGYSDFAIYYCAGSIVRQGLGHQLYDDRTQFRVQQEFAPEVHIRRGPLPYTHPPMEALFFAPFSCLSYFRAFMLWDVLNIVMLVAMPFLVRPYFPLLQCYSPLLWILASLAFFPIIFALMQGQDAILLLFLYTMAFVSLKNQLPVLAGGFLALGLFKFHLVLPFVFLLLVRRRKRILYGFVPVAIGLAVVSAFVVGVNGLMSYPRYVLHLEQIMGRGAIVPAEMPNLRGILDVLPVPGSYRFPLLVISSLALLILAAWKCRVADHADSSNLNFSLAMVATVLVSYHAMGYDLSMLLLPVFLMSDQLLHEGRSNGWPAIVIACGIALLFFSPLQLLLLMRYNRLALLGWVLLIWMFAIGRLVSRLDAGRRSFNRQAQPSRAMP
jgi:hypothetical protein